MAWAIAVSASIFTWLPPCAADDPFTDVFRAMANAVQNMGQRLDDAPSASRDLADIGADFDLQNPAVDLFRATMIRELFFIEKVCQPSEEQLDQLYRRARLGVPKMGKRTWDASNFDDLPDGLATIDQWMKPTLEQILTNEQRVELRGELDRREQRRIDSNASLVVLKLADRLCLTHDQIRTVRAAIRHKADLTQMGSIGGLFRGQAVEIPEIHSFQKELTEPQISIAAALRESRSPPTTVLFAKMNCFSLLDQATEIKPCDQRWERVTDQLRSEILETVDAANDPPNRPVLAAEIPAAVEVDIIAEVEMVEVAEDADPADEPELVMALQPVEVEQRDWSPDSCDHLVVRGASNLNEARRRAEQMLMVRLDYYRDILGDDTNDIAKLRLAGMVDVNEFFADVDRFKRANPSGRVSMNDYARKFEQAREFGERFDQGLHGADSFFRKTTASLDAAAAMLISESSFARNQQIHVFHRQLFLSILSSRIGLIGRQHADLEKLIAKRFPLDESQGEPDYARFAQCLAEIDEASLAGALSPSEIGLFIATAQQELPFGLTGDWF